MIVSLATEHESSRVTIQFVPAPDCVIIRHRNRTGTAGEAAEGAVGAQLEDALGWARAALAAAEEELIRTRVGTCVTGRAASHEPTKAAVSCQWWAAQWSTPVSVPSNSAGLWCMIRVHQTQLLLVAVGITGRERMRVGRRTGLS